MRNYLLYTRTADGEHIEDIEKSGDEDSIIQPLVVGVLRGVANLLEDGTISDDEAFDILRQLRRLDKGELFHMERPTDRRRIALVDTVWEIKLVND